MDWVDVNEQPPDCGTNVLLCTVGLRGSDEGYRTTDGYFLVLLDACDGPIQVFPTHWQPMPEPPEPKK